MGEGDGKLAQAGQAAKGLQTLAGRQGLAGRLTRRIATRQAAGQMTGAAQARLGRVMARRQARQTSGQRVYQRARATNPGPGVTARGSRFASRLGRR